MVGVASDYRVFCIGSLIVLSTGAIIASHFFCKAQPPLKTLGCGARDSAAPSSAAACGFMGDLSEEGSDFTFAFVGTSFLAKEGEGGSGRDKVLIGVNGICAI
jgi:hypothetical protein